MKRVINLAIILDENIEQPNYRIPNSIYTLSDAEETIIHRYGAPTDEFGTDNCYFELE